MNTSLVEISSAERKIAERVDNAIAGGLKVSERGGGVRFHDANQVMEFAKMMAVANIGVRKHLRGNPGACLAVCIQAIEWGMSAYAVANKSYLVNDQIAYESQLVQAVILTRAPIKGRIKFEFTGEGGNLRCRAWARLADEPDEIVEYTSPTWDKIKVKNSPLWKDDPEQQFTYYAGRALCRRHFPDVLLGVYTPDEFVNGRPMLDEVVSETPTAPAHRTISARFDALASGSVKPSETEAEGAGPASGALHEQPDQGDQADGGDAGETDDAGADTGQPTPAADEQEQQQARSIDDSRRSALMHKLRGKAQQGRHRLKMALGGLVPAENEMLTTDDRRYLEGLADDADKEKADASSGR